MVEDDDEEYLATFENCVFYSEQNPSVGIGLDKNQTIELIDCELITNKTTDILNATGAKDGVWAYKNKGGLFYHALYAGNYTNDEGYQKLKVKDCVIFTNDLTPVYGEAGGMSSQVETTFINNSCYSEKNGRVYENNLLNSTNSPLSFGNNIESMNSN